MKSLLELFIAGLKMIFRNRQSLVWAIAFPLIFLTIFGLFNLDQATPSKVTIIDQAKTPMSQNIRDDFGKIDLLKITDSSDIEAAKSELKQGNTDFVMVIPQELQTLSQPNPNTKPVALQVYYNEANVTTNQIVLNLVQQISMQMNAAIAQTPQIFTINTQPLTNHKVRYIDFLMPGILAMGLMNASIIGIAVSLTEFREKHILKRVFATPIPRWQFVSALLGSRLVLSLVQATVIILAARLMFHVSVMGSWAALISWIPIAALVFLALGFVVASLARTSDAAQSIAQIFAMPMMFLSGVFFPTDSLPDVVQSIVKYFPLSPIIQSLRGIIINGESFSATTNHLWIVLAWIVGLFIVAVMRFRSIRQ